MTITTKDSVEANKLGKQGTQSQDSAGKAAEGGRANPVCLELSVTIRGLPTENGGAARPVRLEGRTVIVFDNGAVLRCTESLPIGQSFVLSNPNGRDVVCTVVGGRNLPSVKGYVEVQFVEPVHDFWGIHDSAPAAAVAPKPVESRSDAAQAPVIAAPRKEVVTKHPNMQAGNAPAFDDIGGLLSSPTVPAVTERKLPQQAQPPSEKTASNPSPYSQSGISSPGLVANLTSSEADQDEERKAKQAVAEALSNALASGPMAPSISEDSAAPNSNAFARKGLMAYDQGHTKSAALTARLPMIGGAIALLLVGVGVGAFVMHHGSSPAPVSATADVSQPATAASATGSSKLASDSAAASTAAKGQLPAENVAVEQNNRGASLSALPAVVSNAGSHDSKLDKEDALGADSSENPRTQSAASATKRPPIANLRMSSPSAPKRKPADLGAGAASLTDMVTEPQAVSNAGLLTASSRTAMQPAPPPGTVPPAPVPAAVQSSAGNAVAPKLISSVHLSYPQSAKQTGIQGTVTVIASVDATGSITGAKALSGPLLLRQAAVDSVKQWKYSPGLLDGHPVATQVTVAVEFKLN